MLRFTTYNIAFGFSGRSLAVSALIHTIMRGARSLKSAKLLSKNLDRALMLACSTSADFLCLNEVPAIHGAEVLEKLQRHGYAVIEEGRERHRPPAFRMKTLLAAKDSSASPIPFHLPHLEKRRGGRHGGGGACALEVKNASLVVAGVHLAFSPTLRYDQLIELAKFVGLHGAEKDVVLMGDFNCGLDEIRAHPAWKGISWDGCDENTSGYGVFSWLSFPGNIDHVLFTKRFSLANTEIVKDTSDHYLLTCNIVKRKDF